MPNVRELRAQMHQKLDDAEALLNRAIAQNRELSHEERRVHDDLIYTAKTLRREIDAVESAFGGGPGAGAAFAGFSGGSPLHIGEEQRAFAHYIRSGDRSGFRDLNISSDDSEFAFQVTLPREMRSVDSIMNIAASADGGAAVPTGFARNIALRRNEIRLGTRLGIRNVPGIGTTVNYPFESADPSVFATTAEQADNYANTYERDVAPVMDTKAFTLIKKTKKLALTEELLDDQDASLLDAISDSIGRAIGITHNAMLLTEVAASGTALKTFASATVIATDELEPIVYNDTLGYYLDDGGAVAWVMRPSVYGEIALLDDANARRYASFNLGTRSLLEYPVLYSNQAGATAASAKSVYFGNWYYVGMREDPALRFIRDPYTTDGIVYLKYAFRAVYGVLIAGAVGYGVHPSA